MTDPAIASFEIGHAMRVRLLRSRPAGSCALAAVAGALALSACGSSSSASPGTGSGPGSGANSAAWDKVSACQALAKLGS